MVYESDFYTTRRPYSRPSPTITSYSVTDSLFATNLETEAPVGSWSKKTNLKTTSERKSRFSDLQASHFNLDSRDSSSEEEADLADPYGPYTVFAKYVKPGNENRRARLAKKASPQTPSGERMLRERNCEPDWQRKLQMSDDSEYSNNFGFDKRTMKPYPSTNLSLRDSLFSFQVKPKSQDRLKSNTIPTDIRASDENRFGLKRESFGTSHTNGERLEDGLHDSRGSKETSAAKKFGLTTANFNRYPASTGLGIHDTFCFPEENLKLEEIKKLKPAPIETRKFNGSKFDMSTESFRITPNKGASWQDILNKPQEIMGSNATKNFGLIRQDSKPYPSTELSMDDAFFSLPERYKSEEVEKLKLRRRHLDKYGEINGSFFKTTRKISKDEESSTHQFDQNFESDTKLTRNMSAEEKGCRIKRTGNFKETKQSVERAYQGKPRGESKVERTQNGLNSDDEEPIDPELEKYRPGYYCQKPTTSILPTDENDVPPFALGNSVTSQEKAANYHYTKAGSLGPKYGLRRISNADSGVNLEQGRLAWYSLTDDSDNDECYTEHIGKDFIRYSEASGRTSTKTPSFNGASFKDDKYSKWNINADILESSYSKVGTKSIPGADSLSRKSVIESRFSSHEKELAGLKINNDFKVNNGISRADDGMEEFNFASKLNDLDVVSLEKRKMDANEESPKGHLSYGRIDRFGHYVPPKEIRSNERYNIDGLLQEFNCDGEAPPAHYHLPYVAVKRLTIPQAAPPRSKVRNSVLMAEIDRINHRVRPALGYSAVEHYLNSRLALCRKFGKRHYHMSLRSDVEEENFDSCRKAILALREKVDKKEIPLSAMVNFDDETRAIRAQTAALLKSVHTPLPRSRPLVLPTPSALMETPIPNRITSDAYIYGLLTPLSKVHTDVVSRSFYVENPKPYIGKGHLACVSFAGGRAYAKRRGHVDEEPIHPRNVKNDIATLSFYSRARAVAKGEEPAPEPKAAPRKPRAYRPNTEAAREPAPRAAAARQESVKEAPPPAREAPPPAEDVPAPAEEPAPVTNGINGVEEDPELARLAEEEAELARLEAELAAKESKKKKPKKQASEDGEAAKKAAEEAEAAAKAAEEAEAAKQAELEAEIERQVAAELAAEEAKKKEAELEAEIERQVAAELAAEEAKQKEAELEAEIERQIAAELAAEEAKKKEAELEAEIERQVAAELAAEAEAANEAEPEVSNDAEAEPEVESEPEVEPEPAEIDSEPTPEPEAEVEPEPEVKSEGEPEPLSEPADDEPVIDEPLSQAEDKSVNFWGDDDAKVDDVEPLPED